MDSTPRTSPESARIVVVEDEVTLADAMALRLRADGHDVTVAHDGHGALAACDPPPDLVVLDWMLPDIDGLEVCRRLRARSDVPVLLLTARTSEADVVTALAAGVDDHVGKPVGMRELVARVTAMLRFVARTSGDGGAVVHRRSNLVADAAARRVTLDGDEVHLTTTELDLLLRLLERGGDVAPRAALLREVWDLPEGVASRTLDTHVAVLRRKLGSEVVRTVHGVGYAAGPA